MPSSQNSVDNILVNGIVQTGETGGETSLLKAYDTAGTVQITFATLTAGNPPTFDLSTSTTIGSSYVYRVGGTDVAITDGGTGLSTLPTDGQLLIGNSLSSDYTLATIMAGTAIAVANGNGSIEIGLTNGTDGQLLIGGGTDAVWALPTSTSGTITITGGANTLNFEAGAAVPSSFVTDSGTATPALNVLTVAGGTNIGTTGAGSTVTVNLDTDLTAIGSITTSTAGSLRTGTTSSNTTLLQAYDVDGAFYTTFATLTAANTPTCDLSTSVTMGSNVIYYATGTDVAITDGGTGLSTVPTDGQLLIGNSLSSAYDLATITAGTGISVTNGNGSITVAAGATLPTTFSTDSGTATPALNTLTVTGGTNIGTTGAGSTVTVNLDSDLTGIGSITTSTGGSLRTSTTNGNTTLLQAYDVDGTAYVTFATLTAADTPTCDLSTSVTMGTNAIYYATGTDVAIADGGTGLSTVPTDGQLLIGKTATNSYEVATLTAGTGVGIANAGGSITISAAAAVPTSFVTDSGTATPVANALTVTGGTNIGTVGSGSTVTVNLDSSIAAMAAVDFAAGGRIGTAQSNGNTLLVQAYDVDGSAYTTFATLTAADTPTMDLDDAVTKAGNYIYRASGTDVAVADGGTGISSVPTDGTLLIGSTGVGYVSASLTAGSNITITPGAGSITIAASAGGASWEEKTDSFSIAMGTNYVCDKVSLITATLPVSATALSTFKLVGKGAGLYSIAQNAGQTIHFGNQNTTTGVGGSITAIGQYDSIEIVCITTDTDFVVMSSVGNFTIV